jgi:hypothetical protein
MGIKEDCSQDCELKVGDIVRFKENCGYQGLGGIVGMVSEVLDREKFPFPIIVSVSENTIKYLYQKEKLSWEDLTSWPCQEDEIELV